MSDVCECAPLLQCIFRYLWLFNFNMDYGRMCIVVMQYVYMPYSYTFPTHLGNRYTERYASYWRVHCTRLLLLKDA